GEVEVLHAAALLDVGIRLRVRQVAAQRAGLLGHALARLLLTLLAAPPAEPAATRHARDVDDHAGARVDAHFGGRPAHEIHQGGVAGNDVAARRRDRGRDAVDPHGRDQLRVRVDRGERDVLRVDLAEFHHVLAARRALADLGQAELRPGIDETGI